MTAYIVYQADVYDPEQYEAYKALSGPALAAAGGRFVVRGGDPEVLEGEAPDRRLVITAFPTREAALAFFHSPEYAVARAAREHAANAQAYVVDGYDD